MNKVKLNVFTHKKTETDGADRVKMSKLEYFCDRT